MKSICQRPAAVEVKSELSLDKEIYVNGEKMQFKIGVTNNSDFVLERMTCYFQRYEIFFADNHESSSTFDLERVTTKIMIEPKKMGKYDFELLVDDYILTLSFNGNIGVFTYLMVEIWDGSLFYPKNVRFETEIFVAGLGPSVSEQTIQYSGSTKSFGIYNNPYTTATKSTIPTISN
uniref:Wzt_C domain-containing protein n=1 Tax=Rhabditophanes sp. KR3021 TaxID=114890 RepID=A0AC35TWJ6_9BILA